MLFKSSNIKKVDFAKRLNLSGLVSQMCSGVTKPSDRTIQDICREFGCNEVWLRTGKGDPSRSALRKTIMRFAVQINKGSDDFRKAYVAMLANSSAMTAGRACRRCTTNCLKYKKRVTGNQSRSLFFLTSAGFGFPIMEIIIGVLLGTKRKRYFYVLQ